MYIHPESLLDKTKRLHVLVTRKYGARLRIKVLKKKEEMLKAVIEIDANDRVLKALKKLGIKLTKKPIPALFSKEVLAELSYKIKKPKPIGLGENNEIIFVDDSAPIGVDDKYLAMAIVKEPVLWLDFKGDFFPVEAGYKEYFGFGIPTSQTKIQNIANALASLLKTRPEDIITAMSPQREIMTDTELKIVNPLNQFFEWKVLSEEKTYFGNKNYMDLSGLPHTLQRGALIIATHVWDYDMVIHIPKAWQWVVDIVRYRSGTIILCDTARGLNVPSIICGGKLVRKISFMGSLVVLEKNIKVFWELGKNA